MRAVLNDDYFKKVTRSFFWDYILAVQPKKNELWGEVVDTYRINVTNVLFFAVQPMSLLSV